MKKSLIALAVLAASGASFAQSSTTLYGIADIWFGSVKTTDGVAGTSQRQTKLDSGGVSTSRWGIKGSEDLGGGLKAIFKLEQGFKLDTGFGDTAGQAFSRQSYVGFAGGFGEVAVGKVWSAYDDVGGASNALFDSALAPANNVFLSTGYTDRPINGFRYTTPEISGFTGAVSYSLDEKVSGLTAQTTKLAEPGATVADGIEAGFGAAGVSVASLSVAYANGPLSAQLGYQEDSLYKGNSITTTYADQKFLRLGASYDFGMAVVKATYGKVTNVGYENGADASEYQIGVDVPVGSAVVVSASYAASDDDLDTGFEQSRDGYAIGATYTLSKRTFLYGGYESDTTTNDAAPDSDHSLFAVGVQHRF